MLYEHLDENRRFAMDMSDQERMHFIRRNVVIDTEHLMNVQTIAFNMINITRGSMEAPCLVVTASSNYGKSTICDAIRGQNQEWCKKIRYVTFVKDTKVGRAKPRPLEKLMGAFGLEPGKYGIDINLITEYCLTNDIRAVFMDEFQDSILNLSNQEQLAFLSTLRGMTGPPLYMSFFVFGVAEALNALQFDDQYIRRFEKYSVSPWQADDSEFLNFLETWESLVPLAQPSGLTSRELSSLIHKATDGVVGNMCDLLKAAAAYGVSTGTEKITVETIRMAQLSKWLQTPSAK